MTGQCTIAAPGEREIADIIIRADRQLAEAIASALEVAVKQSAEDLAAIERGDAAPPLAYFASVVHQRMFCLICGADPETLAGGDPTIAAHLIRNSQAILEHYWSAAAESEARPTSMP